jgi:hypothetical protein
MSFQPDENFQIKGLQHVVNLPRSSDEEILTIIGEGYGRNVGVSSRRAKSIELWIIDRRMNERGLCLDKRSVLAIRTARLTTRKETYSIEAICSIKTYVVFVRHSYSPHSACWFPSSQCRSFHLVQSALILRVAGCSVQL